MSSRLVVIPVTVALLVGAAAGWLVAQATGDDTSTRMTLALTTSTAVNGNLDGNPYAELDEIFTPTTRTTQVPMDAELLWCSRHPVEVWEAAKFFLSVEGLTYLEESGTGGEVSLDIWLSANNGDEIAARILVETLVQDYPDRYSVEVQEQVNEWWPEFTEYGYERICRATYEVERAQ